LTVLALLHGGSMKKLLVPVLVLAAVFAFCLSAEAKKLEVLKLDKGEMFNDFHACEQNLDEKNAVKKGGVSLKVTCDGSDESGWVAELPPKRGVWDGYDILKIGIFNPGKTPVNMSIMVRPKLPCTYEERMDYNFVLRPGQNDIEMDIAGSCANNGKAMVWKDRVAMWALCFPAKPKGAEYFIQYVRAETNDEGEKKEEKK
jgi:hypothetical protein